MPKSPSSAKPRFDVLTIGNAIVDVFAQTEDDFLVREGLAKGAMILTSEERADHLYAAMGQSIEISGGSAANTAVGVASLGGKTAYFGKVKQDEAGKVFTRDLRAQGTHFETVPLAEGPSTAKSFIFITPDGERTMNTYLGACHLLGPADIEESVVQGAAITYMEGYLWDPQDAKDAFLKAADIAHKAGRRVAITLSDSFCVDRFRGEFLHLMRSGVVDTVFANTQEIKSLYETSDFETALAQVEKDCRLAIVTRSEDGALAIEGGTRVSVPAFPIDKLVDTTGAGDLFASGFLFGLARGLPHLASLKLGALSAAEVIQHVGARPQTNLRVLAQENGLL
ncbi:carbohydrate kinase [Labrys sp. WJW]|uniref:adenosine kinase n=1 Tax=Labrys sp. WJW TaxID=1737983 RepID=UPI00082EAE52|nr:adenosine kinase [Labrys sp. WJW]OCC02232.1 carbohydrate kinase [Labrys sp. WJW]